jgi:dipeptidyl aminopeptidase/acylaminoacyl peptidase
MFNSRRSAILHVAAVSVCLSTLLACGLPDIANQGSTPSKGLELQDEDYATARAGFHTKLITTAPAPQDYEWARVPTGVTEVVYQPTLRLKGWVNVPKGKSQRKPAVVFLHGGFAFGADDWDQAQPFRDAGFIVLTPILRGENGQQGYFTMFYDEVDDVLAAADYLAKQPYVDPKRIFVAGHSAGGTLTQLAAMASDKFRAAASFSGSPDRITFVNGGWKSKTPFNQSDIREFRLRSPIAYAKSFKCPTRLYVGDQESEYVGENRQTATLAKANGLDVEVVVLKGDHFSYVRQGIKQAAEFFRANSTSESSTVTAAKK